MDDRNVEPIETLSGLQEYIASLPPAQNGHIRVYRGQNCDYGPILPSCYRPNASQHIGIAQAYVRSVAHSLAETANTEYHLVIWETWVAAMVQHYGPGSRYLDVSHSIEVALWFAVNACKLSPVTFVIGPDGPPDLGRDVLAREMVLQYGGRVNGVIYVFDVPEWAGQTVPKHGELVDATKAPAEINESGRVRRQEACLIYADKSVDGGDLSLLLSCPPIPVSISITGSILADRPASAVYPPVSDDPWYARLLGLPFVLTAHVEAPHIIAERSIPITAVVTGEPSDDPRSGWPDVRAKSTCIHPISLVNPLAPAEFTMETGMSATDRPTPAVVIWLETILWTFTPAVPTGDWHEGLLARNLCDSDEYVELDGTPSGRQVGLNDVLFEMSPLDYKDWDSLEVPGTRHSMCRGFRLQCTDANNLLITTYTQHFGGNEEGLETLGPLPFRWIADAERFEIAVGDAPTILADLPVVAKAVYLSLYVLRLLERTVKPQPFPSLRRGKGEGEAREVVAHYVPYYANDAVLAAVPGQAAGPRLFVLRNRTTMGSYIPSKSAGARLIECPGPFGNVPISHFISYAPTNAGAT